MTSVMLEPRTQTFDVSDFLHKRYIEGNGNAQIYYAEEHERVLLASDLYRLREQVGWTHEQLAAKIGSTAMEIERLEDADYEEIPFSLFHKIALALSARFEMRLVPVEKNETKYPQP